MTSKFIGFALFALAFALPSFAMAQTATSTGLLNVYVQVLNQNQYNYGSTYSPANFQISVSGQNPNPSTFLGSQSGTLVSLLPGSYNVTVVNTNGFRADYSVGCNNTIAAGGTQTCVVTITASYLYNYNSNVYPYNYNLPPLTCVTQTPTVALGQTARFTAVGGTGGTYNWTTPGQNYPNVGPVLSISFTGSGAQAVTVTNGSQSATCAITVTNSYYPTPIPTPVTPAVYPVYNNQYPQYPTYNQYPVNQYPSLYQNYAPRFPNTGFAPTNGAEMAFAVVLLAGAAVVTYPYARKAFAIALR